MRCLLYLSTTTLKPDKVKRVWGREGYLAQRESATVEVPSPVHSADQIGEIGISQNPTPPPVADQEKQQLASSLFVGLGSQTSSSLVSRQTQQLYFAGLGSE